MFDIITSPDGVTACQFLHEILHQFRILVDTIFANTMPKNEVDFFPLQVSERFLFFQPMPCNDITAMTFLMHCRRAEFPSHLLSGNKT